MMISVLLCCILMMFLYYVQHGKQQKLLKVLTDLQYDYEQKEGSEAFMLSILKEDMRTCYMSDGETVDGSSLLLDEHKEKVFLSDIIKGKTLVMRLSQQNCQACIMAMMPIVQKLDQERVVFLVDYTNRRYFEEFKKTCNASHRVFKTESLSIPLDSLNIPYFFLLDKDLKMDYTFIPHKEMIDQTGKYLEIVKRKITL